MNVKKIIKDLYERGFLCQHDLHNTQRIVERWKLSRRIRQKTEREIFEERMRRSDDGGSFSGIDAEAINRHVRAVLFGED